MGDPSHPARAIVAKEPLAEKPGPNWSLEEVAVQPIKDGEVLVEIVAAGICHTDIVLTSVPMGYAGTQYPKVAGHEGAGYVRAVGKNVSSVAVGDPVLLSFDYCRTCTHCKASHPSFCHSFVPLNVLGTPGRFKTTSSEEIAGNFFGQSSFAALTAVHEACVFNAKDVIKDQEELKLFAPLGCGFQTGSASLVKVGKVEESSQVVVMGLGGVGLSAIMAAKIKGCRTIIGVDRVRSRLDLAKTFGATHVLDTTPEAFDLVSEVQQITKEGADVALDCTGVPQLLNDAAKFIGKRGKLILVGITPPGAKLDITASDWMNNGKQLIGSIEGDCIPTEWIPQMIQWYREGKFPIDKIVKTFPVNEFGQALHEMHTGSTIKPILLF